MLASHALALVGIPLPRILEAHPRDPRRALPPAARLLPGRRGQRRDPRGAPADPPAFGGARRRAYAIGKTLADLRLHELGVEVSALRRQRVRIVEPAVDTRLDLEDVLVMLGTPSQLANAETRSSGLCKPPTLSPDFRGGRRRAPGLGCLGAAPRQGRPWFPGPPRGWARLARP